MKFILSGILLLSGCASRADLLKFQYEELSRDEKIIDALSKIADNQLVMAKKITAQQADDMRNDRTFLRAGRRAADKTDEQFRKDLDEAGRELDDFIHTTSKP